MAEPCTETLRKLLAKTEPATSVHWGRRLCHLNSEISYQAKNPSACESPLPRQSSPGSCWASWETRH